MKPLEIEHNTIDFIIEFKWEGVEYVVDTVTAQDQYCRLRKLGKKFKQAVCDRYWRKINEYIQQQEDEQKPYWDEDSADDRRRGICY